MYGLDINFLNDRNERLTDSGRRQKAVVRDDPRPIYIGAAAAVALLGLAGGAWLFLSNQNQSLEQQSADLDNQLSAFRAQQSEVANLNNEVAAVETQTQALATVFDQIRPWSAILQDVRARVPNGVQIGTISQITPEPSANAPVPSPSPSPSPSGAASPSPEASPSPVAQAATPATPTSRVQIQGRARSFNDVNDFVLTLQRSPFLDGSTVRLVNSELVDNGTQVEFANKEDTPQFEVKLPRVVQYTIEGDLTKLPASELLKDLERTLSVGLASRIQALRDRGVLKP